MTVLPLFIIAHMANVYVGDIIALAEVILEVCEQAFSRERRPGMCSLKTVPFVGVC